MTEVHQRLRGRKAGDPSLVIRRLDAFVAAAEGLLEAWDPVLDAGAYPRRLPSFDEFVAELQEWRDSAKEMDTVKKSNVAPLDFADAKALRIWLDHLHSDIHDAIAAGDDATRPPSQRDLGRTTARAHILESRHTLRHLLEAAERGMAAPKAEPERD